MKILRLGLSLLLVFLISTAYAASLNYALESCDGDCTDSSRCKAEGPRMLGKGAVFGENAKACNSLGQTKSRAYRIDNDWANGFTFKCKQGSKVLYSCIYKLKP